MISFSADDPPTLRLSAAPARQVMFEAVASSMRFEVRTHPAFLLLESGDNILLEDGQDIELEQVA